jgi:hypothetical protein
MWHACMLREFNLVGSSYLGIIDFNPLHDIPFLNKTIHIRYVNVKGETVLSNSSHANLICQ